MGQKLVQRVSQKQAFSISGEALQSLQILQMPSSELIPFMIQEAESNPFLEIKEFEPSYLEDSNHREYDRYYLLGESLSTNNISLFEHLAQQIEIKFSNSMEKKGIAYFITDNLDKRGFLPKEFPKGFSYKQHSLNDIESVLEEMIKTFEPSGVYARSLKECLQIQCLELGVLDKTMEIILENLDLIAGNKIDDLVKICKVFRGEILDKISLLKSLNHTPGASFQDPKAQIILPDVFIVMIGGKFQVVPNEYLYSFASISKEYLDMLSAQSVSSDDIEFIKRNKSRAKFLVNSLRRRSDTILQVAEFILQEQYDFFSHGVGYLKPMTLSDVATKLGIHESTVSRISNKVIGTESKNYQIKYFFNSKISSDVLENDYSSKSIQNLIKNLIQKEDVKKPLSDTVIVRKLAKRGIKIARRTVTKYRELMRIPASFNRKNY